VTHPDKPSTPSPLTGASRLTKRPIAHLRRRHPRTSRVRPPHSPGAPCSLAREKTIAESRRRQHTRTCRACPARSPRRQAATGPLPWTPTEMDGRQEIEATGVTLHPCTRVALPPAPRCRAGYDQLRITKRPIEESTKRPIDVGRRSRPIALIPELDRQMLLGWRPTTETVGVLRRRRKTGVSHRCRASSRVARDQRPRVAANREQARSP
jgi:hypothetical protein